MKFSTVAASAVFLGMVMAMPQKVVYETEIVTITSCAPDKPDCPYATPTPTPSPYPTTTEVGYPETTTVKDEPTIETTPCAETTTTYVPPIYPNTTTSIAGCTGGYGCPPPPPPSETPTCPGAYGCPPPPSGTGYPPPPAVNTTTPVIPTPPPVNSDSGAGKLGASFIAVIGAAALALLA